MTETGTSAGQHAGVPKLASPLLAWADTVSPEAPPITRWTRRLFRVLLISLREMKTNLLTVRAGYLTYAILLSMVPMLAMSTAVVKGLGGGDQLREVVYSYIESLEKDSPANHTRPAPPDETGTPAEPETGQAGGAEDMIGHLSSAVDQIFDYVDRTNFATLGTFGMVGIIFSVIMVLGQVEKSLNVIWKVEDGRSFLRKVADYLSLMIMMPIALNVALAAGTMLESQSLNVHVNRYLPIEWLQPLLLKGVPILVLTVTLYAVYIFFPNTKTSGKATMAGALVAGTGWFITQNFYISLQIGVAKYNAIYGSFATIPLFLAWVWVGCLFVLFGAQIGYAIQIEPRYRLIRRTPQPVLQISAALDIYALIVRRFKTLQTTYLADLIELLPDYNRDLLENILGRLIDNHILHLTSEDGAIMLSGPPELMTNQNIVGTVLGGDLPDTPGGRTTLEAMAGIVSAFPRDGTAETEGSQETGVSPGEGDADDKSKEKIPSS
ncbi:MAG: YihY/virulence factor BrkB family protein [Desulfofustis sp.]|nr:YihY/virulence factor BrkB family protein [Desulfofustis sp.]